MIWLTSKCSCLQKQLTFTHFATRNMFSSILYTPLSSNKIDFTFACLCYFWLERKFSTIKVVIICYLGVAFKKFNYWRLKDFSSRAFLTHQGHKECWLAVFEVGLALEPALRSRTFRLFFHWFLCFHKHTRTLWLVNDCKWISLIVNQLCLHWNSLELRSLAGLNHLIRSGSTLIFFDLTNS